ncbi:hypothetical protein FKP32DRAFT_815347 [Trametes sanguinea]|nr:hypothetical protein FKP32DRAFT_815347 [Trametes sanguinea]
MSWQKRQRLRPRPPFRFSGSAHACENLIAVLYACRGSSVRDLSSEFAAISRVNNLSPLEARDLDDSKAPPQVPLAHSDRAQPTSQGRPSSGLTSSQPSPVVRRYSCPHAILCGMLRTLRSLLVIVAEFAALRRMPLIACPRDCILLAVVCNTTHPQGLPAW